MPVPIVCLDARVRQWAASFAACFSKPQYQHFVTVLRGLLLCQEARTLSGLRRQVAGGPRIASLSRFIARAPWDEAAVVRTWLARFQRQAAPRCRPSVHVNARRAPLGWGAPRNPS